MNAQPAPTDSREARAARLATFRSELSAHEVELFEAARSAAVAQLTTDPKLATDSNLAGIPERGVTQAASAAMAMSDERRRHHLEIVAAPQAIACQAGCSWCCHMKVSLTAPELFVLLDYIENNLPEHTRERVKARAAELSRDPRIFSSEAKVEARLPCALLSDEGACSVYAARPLACRAYNSLDAEACRKSLDDDTQLVEWNEPLVRDCTSVALGLLAGIEDTGLAAELLELTSALHIALNEPAARERWLAGDAVFAAAQAEL